MLEFAIYAYTEHTETDFLFCKEQYDEILKRLPSKGQIVFYIKQSSLRRYNPYRWCEIIAISDNKIYNIVYSEDDYGNLVLSEI